MKMRIEKMGAGTWFRSGHSVLVKLAGAVLQGNSTFQAVDIHTGDLACPCGAGCSPQLKQIEYEVMEQPEMVMPTEGRLKFDAAAERDAVLKTLQKEYPHVNAQPADDRDEFVINFATTRAICQLIELRFGR